jgi:hypothetical protein
VSDVVAVGFVPAAPLLIPAVAGGSAHLDAELREACRAIVRSVCETGPEVVTVVAAWHQPGGWSAERTWGFEGFGVARQPADDRQRLPWPLGIGAWLLDDAGWDGARRFLAVSPEPDPAAAEDSTRGAPTDPAIEPGRVALLVVGDGSARRSEKAPGHLDERAEGFDAAVAAAIRAGDVRALGGLDRRLAAELMCAGAPAWRWLSDAIGDRDVADAELLADTAPYGVAYFAGIWRLKA